MNKLSFTLTQLLNELTVYESMMMDKPKSGAEANVAESSKSEKMKKKSTRKPKGKAMKKKNKKSSKVSKPKGKCFHYNKDGHWKRNCPKYLAQIKEKKNSGKYDILVVESLSAEEDKSAWIIDSGATDHVFSSL